MSVTVVTVNKNNSTGLLKTLESLSSLINKPNKVIVIDGLSNDDPLSIVESSSNILNIDFISEDDDGIYDAMNKGRLLVLSGLIHYLNSGDVVIGEPYCFSHKKPFRLKVNTVSNSMCLLDIPVRKDGTFCHQGLLFPFNHALYNTNYKISADFDVILSTFPTGVKSLPKNNSGGILFDLEGVSSVQPFRRDLESIKILFRRGDLTRIVNFIFGRVKSLPGYLLKKLNHC
jgi:glycosyltransferase involved in cell wall biosynthesis